MSRSYRLAMKTQLFFVFWALLASIHVEQAVAQGSNCFRRSNCTGSQLEGSLFTFESCCLEVAAQSYRTASGECSVCSNDTVEFGSVSYSVDEGNDFVSLELVRYGDQNSELVVSITLKDGTAKGGFDYGFFPEAEVTFNTVFLVNETSIYFGVRINDDNIVEDTDYFTASLSLPSESALDQLGFDVNPNPANLRIGGGGSTVVSIIDNDFVNITISPEFVEVSESEVDQPIVFVVRKEGLSERAVEVIAFTRNISVYAIDGQDYIGISETVLRFEPSDDEMELDARVRDDSIVEYSEQFSVVLLEGEGEKGVMFPQSQTSTVQIMDDNDFVELRFEQPKYTVREEEGFLPVSIIQIGESERPIIFTVAYNESTTSATNGSDFSFTQSILTTQPPTSPQPLAPGETLLIGEVQVFKDGRYELDENVTLEIFPAEGELSLVSGEPASIVLEDSDEVLIGFAESQLVKSEPSSFNVSVVLFENNLDPGTAVSLDITALDGIATDGEDYSFSVDSASFEFSPDNDSLVTVAVEIIDDEVFEGREDFSFVLSTQQPRVVFSSNQTIAITDNEDLLIEFDMDIYEVNETDGFLLVVVELSSMIERDIELQLNTKDGRATGEVDYEAISRVLNFRPDSSTVTTTIAVYDDDLNEGLEDFTLQLILTDEQLGMPDILRESVVRIFDDEVTFVEFSAETYTVSEGDNFVALVINKTGVTQEDIPVIVQLEDGTAKAGASLDYGPFNSRSLSLMARLLASEVSVPFGVVIREDRRVEEEEYFTASLSLPPIDGSNVKLGRVRTATVYIKDNDKINVTVFPGMEQIEESDSIIRFNVSRSDDLTLDRNVFVAVTTEPGTAQASDFSAIDVVLTFTDSGPRVFEFPLEIFQDAIAEGNEQLFVRLSAAPGEMGVTFARDYSHITILDDDVSLVQFSRSLFQGDEINGGVDVCLTKDLETSSAFTVVLVPQETTPSPPDTFQARADVDFDSSPINMTFAPEDKLACGTITVFDDAKLGESREVFAVSLLLSAEVPNVEFGAVRRTIVEVTDTPDVLFGFERTEIELDEAAGDFQLCVLVFNPGPDDIMEATIDFVIVSQPGTADSSDFKLISGNTATLSNSTRRVCFSLEITDDILFENEVETFSFVIEIENVLNSINDTRVLRVLSQPNTITISIIDNDRDILIGFEETEFSVDEGNVMVELCVGVSRPTLNEDLNAVINIIVATISGTAGPSDYSPISAIDRDTVLVISNATRRDCFKISIKADSLFEGPEVFTVQLTAQVVEFLGPRQTISVSPSIASITIIDNSTQLTVGFEERSSSRRVLENVGTISLCVEVSGREEITMSFSVRVDFLSGTADPQLDFILESGLTLTFDDQSRRQCFDVEIVSGAIDEEEFFDLGISLVQFLPGLIIDPDNRRARITILQESTVQPTTSPPVVANDTVIGDPLFTVPLNVANGLELLPTRAKVLDGFPNLCYEIHGENNRHFSLVSDTCATVNALYSASNSPSLQGWNVISTIGVRAVNNVQRCINIEVGVENGCVPVITEDRGTSIVSPRYQSGGITVSKHRNQVRVSVPNCRNIQLVMWITCQNASGFPMIRYDITRGINLRPTSHGLIGQFWNVPINISRYTYTGPLDIDYLDLDSLYAVTVSPPLGSRVRTFIAELYTFTWEPRNEVCFYAGNIQGGKLAEITDDNFNDPVIEGSYEDYVVEGLFEHDFAYSRFSADMC